MKGQNDKIYDRFNNAVLQTIIFAKAASINAEVDCIFPESFAIGILTTGANEVTSALISMKIDLERCLKKFKESLSSHRVKGSPNYNDLKISKQVIQVCEAADRLSKEMGYKYIGVEHIFVALINNSKEVRFITESEQISVDEFFKHLKKTKSKYNRQNEQEELTVPDADADVENILETYCTDMTKLARENKLDPIIARDREIDVALTILCRRNKSNPILLGEPGVGKTAIVEGMAQRIVSGTVPKCLLGHQIYSLSLASLVAGTKYRGEFEERVQALVREIEQTKSCILFIDEIHTIVGAGSGGSGALDASNILKPFLARGDLKCIGATTSADYKKYFSKDGALVRRFEKIVVEEPTKAQVRLILCGIRSRLEDYHHCLITDDALDASIEYTDQYLPTKNFPDKSIDVLDTACAKHAWHSDDRPSVSMKDVAGVVSEQSQIPIEAIMWDNNDRLIRIEHTLRDRVVGQDHAVAVVCRTLKNAYSGVRDPQRPIGSFLFGGPTGTGKTYMAKEMSSAVFGKESSLIRLDMSEFSESHSVSKLIGSPPGYVGFREVDVFVDKIRRKPYSIVLLDEVEKSHADVMKTFLQVMAEGCMTDAMGEKVDFRHVIIVMTGNFGMNDSAKNAIGFSDSSNQTEVERERKRLIEYCRKMYGAEFVNRVDEFVPFLNLSDEMLWNVAWIQVVDFIGRIHHNRCKITFTDEVPKRLVQLSKLSHGMNATILGRIVAKELEPCVADALLSIGNTKDENYILTIDVKKNDFMCRKRKDRNIKSKLIYPPSSKNKSHCSSKAKTKPHE